MIIELPTPERDPGPYSKGRFCVHEGCITELRRTNPGPSCECHTPPVVTPAVVDARAWFQQQAEVVDLYPEDAA